MSTKRILAFVLALSMIFSLIMPGYAFADTGETIEESTTVEEAVDNTVPEAEAIDEEPAEVPEKDLDEEILEEDDAETFGADEDIICRIGSKEFYSLTQALNWAKDGDVIEMLGSTTEDGLTITKKITIKFAPGFYEQNQITGNITVDGGELTLEDLVVQGNIDVINNGKISVRDADVTVRQQGNITTSDGTGTGGIEAGTYSGDVDDRLLTPGYDQDGDGKVGPIDGAVAMIDGTPRQYFQTIDAAAAVAGSTTPIILLQNVNYNFPANGKMIIDKNGKTFNYTPATDYYVTEKAVAGGTEYTSTKYFAKINSDPVQYAKSFSEALSKAGTTNSITLFTAVSDYTMKETDQILIASGSAAFNPKVPEGFKLVKEDGAGYTIYTIASKAAKVELNGTTTYYDDLGVALAAANGNGGVATPLTAFDAGFSYTMASDASKTLKVYWGAFATDSDVIKSPTSELIMSKDLDSGVTTYKLTQAKALIQGKDWYPTFEEAVKNVDEDHNAVTLLDDAEYALSTGKDSIVIVENGFTATITAPEGFVVKTRAAVDKGNNDAPATEYYLVTLWTVTYDSDGGTEYDPEVVENNAIVVPGEKAPVKPGYTFQHWVNENNETVGATEPITVVKNRTFKAIYTQNEYRIVIMNTSEDLAALINKEGFKDVNWASDTDVQAFIEGSTLAATNLPHLTYGQVVDGPEQLIPEKPGYKHVGYATMVEGIWWDYEAIEAHADPFLFPYTVTDVEKPVGTENGLDKVLFVFGTFEAIDYTVTYNSDGGTEYEPETYNYDEIVVPGEKSPVKAGYTFLHWVNENNEIVGETEQIKVEKDRTFTAVYEQNEYRIVIMNTSEDLAALLNKEGFKDVNWASDTDVQAFIEGSTLAATNLPHLTYGQVVDGPETLIPEKAGYKHVGYATMVEGIWWDYKDIEAHADPFLFPYTVTDVEKPVGTENGLDKVLFVFGTFEAIDYTVTFDANGGTFADGEGTYVLSELKYGDEVSAPAELPEYPGYTFAGWYTENDTRIDAHDGETAKTVTVNADRVITAQWTQDDYNIKLFNDKDAAVEYLTTATSTDLVAANIPNVHYGDTIYAPEEYLPKIAGKTLVGYAAVTGAFWKDINNKPEIQSAEIAFSFDMFTPYDLSVLEGTAAEGVDLINTLYIFAVYEDDLFTVTFDANGGAFADGEAVKVTENLKWKDKIAVPLGKDAPVRTGYKFMGWLDEQGEPLADDTIQITVKADRTFTANWKAVPYTVLVFKDKATVETYLATDTDLQPEATSIAVNIGDTVEAPETVPVVPGKTLIGFAVVTDAFWKVGADQKPEVKSEGIEFPFEMFVPYELDKKLFPQAAKNTLYIFGLYEEDLYNVNFDANGGVFADGEATKTVENFKYKDTINIYAPELIPTRTGYSFYAYTDENGKTILAADGTITVRKDRFFTAQWTQDVYSIYLFNDITRLTQYIADANAADSTQPLDPTGYTATNIPEVHYGDVIEEPTQYKPVWEGKTLVGYAALTDAFWKNEAGVPEIKSVEIGFSFEMPVPYNLKNLKGIPANALFIYGVFDTDLHTVTFDANGGAFADGDEIKDIKNVEYGTSSTKLAIPENPVRVGYTFNGWENEDGEIFKPLPEFQVKADRLFTAHWTQDAYRVVILNSQEDFKDLIKLLINAIADIGPADEEAVMKEITKLINDFVAINLMPAHLGDTVNEPATFKPSLPGGTFTGYENITGFTWATVNANKEVVATATDISIDFELSSDPISFSFEMPVPPEIFTMELLRAVLPFGSAGSTTVPLDDDTGTTTPTTGDDTPDDDTDDVIQAIHDILNKFMFICGTFEMNEYTVTFDANGGAFADGTDEIVVTGKHYGDRVAIPAVDPVLVGYSFGGWYAEDGTTPIGTSVLVNGDRVASAKWTQDVYSIKLFNDKDAAAEYLSSATPTDLVAANIPAVHYGDTIEAPVEFVPTAEGKTLVGYAAVTGAFWRDASDPAKVEIKSAEVSFPFDMYVPYDLTVLEDLAGDVDLTNTLYIFAVYEEDIFTVTFDANGGAFADGDEIKDIENVPYGTMSSTLDIPADPVLVGYTFTGWENEDGEVYKPLPDFAIKADRTFKANWTADVYNIMIFEDKAAAADFLNNGNGSEQGYNISAVHIGDTIEAPQTVPTKEGAKLVGYEVVTGAFWNALVPATGDTPSSYAPEIKFVDIEFPFEMFVPYDLSMINEDVENTLVIYGVWDIDEHTVVFDADGGTFTGSDTRTYNAVANNNVEYGSKITYPAADPVRPGYAFIDWEYDNGLHTTTKKLPKTATEDMVYTAQWKLNKYAIQYENDLNQAGNPTVFTVEDLPITLTNPSATGYIFNGWTSETLGITEPTTSFTIPEGTAKDIKVAENWTIINYNIEYALDGGDWGTLDPTSIPRTYTVNTETFDIPQPYRQGYDFRGWLGAPVLPLIPQVVVTVNQGSTGDITLYATWSIQDRTLTVDPMNGENATVRSYNYGTTIRSIEEPVWEGHTFTGWYTMATVDDETTWVPTAFPFDLDYDTVIHATWSTNAYTITFDPNGAEFADGFNPVVELYYGSAIESYIPDMEDTDYSKSWPVGYDFAGWTLEDGSAIPETMPAQNLTAVANWTPHVFTVTFKSGSAYEEGKSGIISPDTGFYTKNYSFDVPFGDPIPVVEVYYPEHSLTWVEAKYGYNAPDTMPAEDLTFVASWEGIDYTLHLDANGGTMLNYHEDEVGELFLVGSVDDTLTEANGGVAVDEPTRLGYEFHGWENEAGTHFDHDDLFVNDKFPAYDTVNLVKGPAMATYTALWDAVEYTVIFKIDDDDYDEGATMFDEELGHTVKAITYTLHEGDPIVPPEVTWEGHNLQHWTWKNLDGKTSYVLPETMPALEAETAATTTEPAKYPVLKFTAMFEGNRYLIAFDANGGLTKDEYGNDTEALLLIAKVDQQISDVIESGIVKPVRPGYTFRGWEDRDGKLHSSAEFKASETFPMPNAGLLGITVYTAAWTADIWDVTFKADSNLSDTTARIVDPATGLEKTSLYYGVPTDEAVPYPANLYKPGYTFYRWALVGADNVVTSYVLPTTVTSALTFVAEWTINTYTITIDPNGGEYELDIDHPNLTDPLTFVAPYGEDTWKASKIEGEITREGYAFSHWEDSLGNCLDKLPTVTGDETYTAIWTIKNYPVTFAVNTTGAVLIDPETGLADTDGVLNYSLPYGSAIPFPADPTKTGYSFTGWKEVEMGYGYPNYVPAESKWHSAGGLSFVAEWEINEYTITIDPNGGVYNLPIEHTDLTEPLTFTTKYNYDVWLASKIEGAITREGYTFSHWEDTKGNEIASLDGYPATCDETYTAIWKINTNSVTYTMSHDLFEENKKDGVATMGIVDPKTGYLVETVVFPSVVYGAEIPSVEVVFADHSYTWVEKTYGLNLPTIMPDEDLLFTALFEGDRYVLHFDANGGTLIDEHNDPTEDLYLIGSVDDRIAGVLGHKLAEPVRAGYTFHAWVDKYGDHHDHSEFGGVASKFPAPDGSLLFPMVTTYTAMWTANEHHIKFIGDGGMITNPETLIPAADYEYVGHTDEEIAFPADPEREGYTFTGWKLTYPTQSFVLPTNVGTTDFIFTAQWEINEYKITIDPNGGEYKTPIDHDKQTEPLTFTAKYRYDVWKASTIEGSITRDGYTFSHWEDSQGNCIATLSGLGAKADETYTAIWKINANNVTYTMASAVYQAGIKDGVPTMGIVDPKTGYLVETVVFENVEFGAEIPSVEVVYADHTFTWIESSFGYNAPATMPDQDLVFTAAFEGIDYILHLDANGGTMYNYHSDPVGELFLVGNVDKTVKSANGGVDLQIVRPGYTFHAWVNEAGTHYNFADIAGGKFPSVDTAFEVKRIQTVTYTAEWTPIEYTVTFYVKQADYDGGARIFNEELGYDASQVVYNIHEGEPIVPPVATYANHTLQTWTWENLDGYLSYVMPETMPALPSGTTNISFEAMFEGDEYILHFDANGGTLVNYHNDTVEELFLRGSVDNVIYTVNGNHVVDPVRPGYTFHAWVDSRGVHHNKAEFNTEEAKFPAPIGTPFLPFVTTFTAMWEPLSHTIKFEGDGGMINNPETLIPAANYSYIGYTDDAVVFPEDPERVGYTFTGWKLTAPTQSFVLPTNIPNDDLTFTAQWEANKFDVTVDANGGLLTRDGFYQKFETITATASTKDIEGQSSVAYVTGITARTNPTGFDFSHWENSLGEDVGTDLSQITVTGPETYTAIYTIKSFNVAFNAMGGTIEHPVSGERVTDYTVNDVNYGDEIVYPADPVRPGYVFDCWKTNTLNLGFNVPATMPDLGTTGDTLHIYATWNAAEYTLTFDANGGSIYDKLGAEYAIYEFTAPYGTNLSKLISDYLVSKDGQIAFRTGYTLNAWLDEIGNPYWIKQDEGMPIGGLYLTAQWTENEYTVAFDMNGGTFVNPFTGRDHDTTDPAGQNPQWDFSYKLHYGDEIIFPEVSKTGYEFKGWVNHVTGYNYETTMPDGDTYFYATWDADTRIYIYDADGGEFADPNGDLTDIFYVVGETGEDAFYPGKGVDDKKDIPFRAGYQFNGWYDELGDKYTTAQLGRFNPMGAEDKIFTADWTPYNYTVAFNSNGGKLINPNTGLEEADGYYEQQVEFDTQIPFPADPTAVGYTFIGWEEVTEGLGLNYPTFMPNKDLGFKARWQVNEITFTFNANGGQVADKLGDLHDSIEISGKFNTTPAWYPGYPVATGYTFAGWFDVENQENLTAVHPFDKDRTLEARWEVNKFYVIYDLNDYESVIHPITGVEMTKDFSIRLAYGTEVPYPAATKVGYTFQGWMEKVDGFNLPETMPNRDITLTAVWNDNYYVVSFNGNGGVMDTHGIAADGSPAHIDTVPGYFVIGKYAETIDNPIQGTLVRPGYDFHGWVDDSTPLAEHYDDGMLPGTFTANVNYTALWDVKSYNVKYQAGGGKVISLVTGTPVDEFTLTGINYGETIPVPEVPVLTGYTFKGWYETNVGYGLNGPETMPALEEAGVTTLIYVAQWEINEYTITFDGNGGLLKTTALDHDAHVDWTGYYQISGKYDASTDNMLPTDVARAGYAFHGFVDQDGKHYDLKDQHLPAKFPAKDMYFVAIWGAENQTVKFDPMGGKVIDPLTFVPSTSTITLTLPTDSAVPYPDVPTKTGYTFAGWREAKLGFTYPETVPAGGLTFYAEWTADENTVTYDANGGLVKDSYGNPVSAFDITAATDAAIYYPPEKPVKVGYTFLGWDNTKGQRIAWTEVPATMPAGGEYYTAAWELNKHAVWYVPNGGTAIHPTKYTEEKDNFYIDAYFGDEVMLPQITRTGYDFAGWVETTYGFNTPETVPDFDLVFTAKWAGIDYTVTFDGNGGIILTKGLDELYPTSLHIDFVPSYTVVGTVEDNLPVPDENHVKPSIDPDPTAVRYGYVFNGWIDTKGKHYNSVDIDNLNGGKFPAYDEVFTAEWVLGVYTLTFDADGGKVVDPETGKTSGKYVANLPFEAAISYPEDPVRTGYTFKGWEETVIGYNYPEKMPGYNLYYTAKWTALPDTVTYDANGGTILNKAGIAVPYFSVEAKVDAPIYAPNAQLPVREGYDFLYWIDSKENHYNAGTLPGTMPAGGEVYTAMWKAHEYNLYFNPGQKTYGTAKVEDPTNGEYYAKEIALKLKMGDEIVYPGVVYPGYDFLGWTSEQVLGTPTTMPSKDVRFTANWKAIRYNITYDMGGGYIPTGYYNPDTYTMDDGAITLVNPVHEGYTFTGWTGSGLDVPTTVVTIPAGTTGDLSYTATWKVNTYVVTFRPAGGTVINPLTGVPSTGAVSINVNYGEPVPYAAVSMPGYEFKGWCDSILGFVLPATMPAQNLDLIAVWKGLDISVTFDGNGGLIPTMGLDGIITSAHGDLVPSYTVVGKIGDKVVRPYDNPTRAGYTFHGWVDEAGKHYDTEDIPTQFKDMDKVYTAQWKALPHTVSFDANFGTVVNPATGVPTTAIYSIKVNTGDTIPYPETPTRLGFTFYGWQEVNMELGFSHPEFMPNGDLKFVAIWTPVANTVTYDANGGTVLNKAQYAVPYFTIEAKTGDDIYRPTEAPVRYGYDFAGWYDSDDNLVKIADLAQKMPVTGETYVAHWKGHKVDVVFYKTPDDVNADNRYRQMFTFVGDTVKVPLEPVIAGYDFGGWYYFEKDNDGKFIRYIDLYDLDAPVTVDATILLVGMWSLGTYDVTYNANGGLVKDPTLYDVASFTITNQYGKEIYAPADAPIRVGYDFAGWYNSQNVKVPRAELPTTMPAGGDVFTAHWQIKNFKMTFYAGPNGYWIVDQAATNTIVKTQTFGSALTAPVAPTNPGHVFDGWTPAVPSTVPGENMTFTAKWKTLAYTVTFDSNGGTDVDPQTVEYGQLATEPKNGTDLFKKGYNLLGWFELQENGTLAAVKFDFTKPVTRNMTLVAKWEGFPAVIHWMDGNVILRRDALHIGDLIIRPETVDYSILQRGKDGYRLDPEHLWTPEVPEYVEESMVFMLNWIKQIDVFFNVGGKIVKHIQVDEGSTLDENPDVPVVMKDGYKLVWFVDGFEFPNNRPIGNCDALNLTATWVPVTGHTVSFDPANGQPVFTVSVEDGQPVAKPADPVKEGYNFIGWFDGDDEFDFTKPVTDDTNLTAKYESKVLPSASYTYRLILGDSTDILYSVNNITAGTNPEDYTIEYTYKGVTSVDTLTDAKHNEFIIAKCAAKEMTEPVHVVVRYQGEVIKDASYTCRGYSEYVMSSPSYELHLKNLVKAMLDFGTYAQTYFGYNVGDLANRGTNYYNVPAIVIPAHSNTKTGSATGITSISYSLIVDSRTTLNVSFNHEAGANIADYVFTVDGMFATAVDTGSAFVVYIDGIIARDLGVNHVVNVTNLNDGTTLSFTSAPVNYMYAAQSVAGLGNLMKAMYNYSQYASGALM